MTFNPAQLLNPRAWNRFIPEENQVMPGMGNLIPDPGGAPMSLPESPNLAQMPIPAQPNQIQPDVFGSGKRYFKGVPVPLSQNNPFLAYLPQPGKGMIVTQKFIQDAINWENKEQERQDIEDNRRKLAGVIMRELAEAAENPDLADNRNMINYYGGLTDLIELPGGEKIANDILASLESMYGAKPEQIDPKEQAAIEKANLENKILEKKLAQMGLESTQKAEEDLIKKYNAVMGEYDKYVKSIDTYNKGIPDPEMKKKPLKPVDWLKQPGREGSLSVYNQVTGNKVKSLEVPFSTKTKKQVETEERIKEYVKKHHGVGRAMKALWENIPQEEMQMLLDRYNENLRKKNINKSYTLKQFYEKFIK